MSAEPAYSYYSDGTAARAPERARNDRPRIDVVPGGRPQSQEQSLSAGVLTAARVVAVALVLLAALAMARVALSSATIEASLQEQELSTQIEEARSDGTSLEVSESLLSSPSRLKQEASALGMTSATASEVISLEEDVVVLDDSGDLSLSMSVAQAASLAD